MKKNTILYIEWIDSHNPGTIGWHTKDDIKEWAQPDMVIKDVGFLLKEDKDMIYLIGGCSKKIKGFQQLYHREIAIPKGCILKKNVLR